MHSIPPKTNSKPHRPSNQSTTVSKHTKYDKVPTQEINSFNQLCDINNKKQKVPRFYKLISKSLRKEEMGIDSQSQMKQNMSQIFSMEEPIKPSKELLSQTKNEEEEVSNKRVSLLPQVGTLIFLYINIIYSIEWTIF